MYLILKVESVSHLAVCFCVSPIVKIEVYCTDAHDVENPDLEEHYVYRGVALTCRVCERHEANLWKVHSIFVSR